MQPGVEDSEVILGFRRKELRQLLVTGHGQARESGGAHPEDLLPVRKQVQPLASPTTLFLAGLLLDRMKEPDPAPAFLTTEADCMSQRQSVGGIEGNRPVCFNKRVGRDSLPNECGCGGT